MSALRWALAVGLLSFGGTMATPASVAGACSEGNTSTPSCYFFCDFEVNGLTVSASGSKPWSVEAQAMCDGATGAMCAGHGSCAGEGAGVFGQGLCTGATQWPFDVSIGCAANEHADACGALKTLMDTECGFIVRGLGGSPPHARAASFSVTDGVAEGRVCASTCWPVEVTCAVGPVKYACGIGVDEARLREMYGV